MAQSEVSSSSSSPSLGSPTSPLPIVVLYVREPAHPACALDEHLRRVVARYQGVELRTIAPDDLASEYAYLADCSPSVIMLRGDQVISSAIGDGLPSRELDEMLHAAVRWPH